jgi:hypothetical protein
MAALTFTLTLGVVLLRGKEAPAVRYRNERWGFCLSYPTAWSTDEGVNRSGIAIYTPESSPARAIITVGALPNQPAGMDSDKPMGLEQNVKTYVHSLQTHPVDPITHVHLVREGPLRFQGVSAIRTEISYDEGGSAWVEQTVWFLRNDAVYTLQLKCLSRDRERYDPVFEQVRQTFRFECAADRSR